MDTFVVDTGEYLSSVGEEVVLLDGKSVQTVAKQRNTIEYTVYTSFKGRVQRYYKRNGQEIGEKDSQD